MLGQEKLIQVIFSGENCSIFLLQILCLYFLFSDGLRSLVFLALGIDSWRKNQDLICKIMNTYFCRYVGFLEASSLKIELNFSYFFKDVILWGLLIFLKKAQCTDDCFCAFFSTTYYDQKKDQKRCIL